MRSFAVRSKNRFLSLLSVRRQRLAARGFALVITLSLSILLVVMAVGLMSTASIVLRTGAGADASARAKANARMALMLAIGQLQKQAGKDTRVTARADIQGASKPPILGVWKSWEGTDHDTQGRPIAPGSYESAKDDRFLAWLNSENSKSLPGTTARKGSVALVGEASVGKGNGRSNLQVHLVPTEVRDTGGRGGIAWWIGGENQKARLPKPYQPEEDSSARWAVMTKTHSVADPSQFRMEQLLKDMSPAEKAISLSLARFVGKDQDLPVSQEFFHDLSTTSIGLLTNTATGGWRKDLSLLTENWTQVPTSNLPFFRLNPEKDITFTKPTTSSPTAARSMIYPWSSYRGSGGEIPIYRHGPVSSWENLKDYDSAYQRISTSASGRSRMNMTAVSIDDSGQAFNFLHKVRMMPIVARVQWVFSHTAGAAAGTGGNLEPRLLLTPVVTMWNPYSVELTAPALTFDIAKPLPVALRYNVSGTASSVYNCLTAGSNNNLPAMSTATSLRYDIPSGFTLKPGEARIFSPQGSTVALPGQTLSLSQGCRTRGGHVFPVLGSNGKPLALPPTTMIMADAKFDTAYTDINQGVGIYLDLIINGQRMLVYRMTYTPAIANEVYKPLTGLGGAEIGKAMGTPVPFLATVFGARTASKTHIPAKGFVQSSPLVNYTAMGSKDQAETTIARHYLGTNHPVNSPFDYSFVPLSQFDSSLPNESDTTGRGYIVTGFNKGDGLSRCVIAEIPVRPLHSLGELQHWDMRYENPIPPYAFNLIGNSDATPLIPANAVVDKSNASLAVNLQHDDSYCANHILFDDWFFSSIAPDPDSFGASGKDIQRTYVDFVTGQTPLGNRAYHAIAQDRAKATSTSGANSLYTDYVKGANTWKTIASRLEVEGMFNVNSTSQVAWRALLGHARNQKVPYIKEAGSAWSIDLSGETDHAFGRFVISGDVQAGKMGSAGDFSAASEFSGYRVLDDSTLDAFAEEIVKQVRSRGPFLSLAEFVNRQLSSGDLALAGTIQSALNQLGRGASNPYSGLESMSTASVAAPVRAADAEYRFPEAAVGRSAYGLPGWTRQADVLRAIAPILTARDDTFVIRAHGDARDDQGNILSRAVCEAVVRRVRDYVDSKDAADLPTPPTSAINQAFGRHFELVRFRWLSPSEI